MLMMVVVLFQTFATFFPQFVNPHKMIQIFRFWRSVEGKFCISCCALSALLALFITFKTFKAQRPIKANVLHQPKHISIRGSRAAA